MIRSQIAQSSSIQHNQITDNNFFQHLTQSSEMSSRGLFFLIFSQAGPSDVQLAAARVRGGGAGGPSPGSAQEHAQAGNEAHDLPLVFPHERLCQIGAVR
jgi:hypothetical protein